METTLSVPQVHCGHCVSSIETALGILEGVSSAMVDLEAKKVTVSYDEDVVTIDRIAGVIQDQGYDVGDGFLHLGKPPQ